MDPTRLLLIVFPLWLALFCWGLVGWLTGRAHRQRALAAEQRQWRYFRRSQDMPYHFRFGGRTPHGLAWELRATRRIGRRGVHVTWIAATPGLPGGVVIVLPRPTNRFGQFPPTYKELLLKTVLGKEAMEMSRALRPVSTGREVLHERYFILATHDYAARRLLNGQFESLLLGWPAAQAQWRRPTVVLWKRELQVKLMQRVRADDMLLFDRLVRLGSVALESYQQPVPGQLESG